MSEDARAWLDQLELPWNARALGRYDALPAELLAQWLADAVEPARCHLAYLLARRDDPRGIAVLARAATALGTAQRALGYLDELAVYDMLPPEFTDAAWRTQAAAAALVGGQPDELELLLEPHLNMPDRSLQLVALFRWRLGERAGLVLVGAETALVERGWQSLDNYDRLALAVGTAREDKLRAVPLPSGWHVLVKRRAWMYLGEPRPLRAWAVMRDIVIAIAVTARGKPGILVGGLAGVAPLHWLPLDPDDPLDADAAVRLWLGRLEIPGR